jgi:PAT family beta-lactamase induction signal transducer AmpG
LAFSPAGLLPWARVILSIFRGPRVRMLAALGFASGLPYLLTGSTLSARLANAGVDLATIGLLSLASMPYSLKPLWAPLLDRYRPPGMSRRRGWIALTQLGLSAAIAWLAVCDERTSPTGLAVAALVVVALSASQDIVCDAYQTDLLEPEERAAGGATFVFGYRVAMVVAGGLALILADHLRWRTVYLLLAAVMALGLLATVRAPEPPGGAAPRTLGEAVVAPVRDLARRPGAGTALAFLVLYRIGDIVAVNLAPVMLIEMKFSNSEIGAALKGLGLAATIAGALGGGSLVARWGLPRSLWIFGLLQGVTNLGYSALSALGKQHALMWTVVGIDNLAGGLGMAATVALLMALCDKRYSATQFAILSAATGVGGRLAGAGAGWAAQRLGWPIFFVATAAVALPGLALLPRLGEIVDHNSERRRASPSA